MAFPVGAFIFTTLLSAGMSYYQSEEQRKAAEEAQDKAEAERKRQQLEAERIARETRPDPITATGIEFGVETEETETMDFLVKRPQISKTAGVNTVGTAGLGYS